MVRLLVLLLVLALSGCASSGGYCPYSSSTCEMQHLDRDSNHSVEVMENDY